MGMGEGRATCMECLEGKYNPKIYITLNLIQLITSRIVWAKEKIISSQWRQVLTSY